MYTDPCPGMSESERSERLGDTMSAGKGMEEKGWTMVAKEVVATECNVRGVWRNLYWEEKDRSHKGERSGEGGGILL
jgi:hypothetical protein